MLTNTELSEGPRTWKMISIPARISRTFRNISKEFIQAIPDVSFLKHDRLVRCKTITSLAAYILALFPRLLATVRTTESHSSPSSRTQIAKQDSFQFRQKLSKEIGLSGVRGSLEAFVYPTSQV